MLGLIHRSVMGCGMRHFEDFFSLSGAAPPPGQWQKHRFQLHEHRDDTSSNVLSYAFGHGRGGAQGFVMRSALGLVSVCNRLPKTVVEDAESVSHFQSLLQDLVKQRAASGFNDLQSVLSPRVAWQYHPLVHLLENT